MKLKNLFIEVVRLPSESFQREIDKYHFSRFTRCFCQYLVRRFDGSLPKKVTQIGLLSMDAPETEIFSEGGVLWVPVHDVMARYYDIPYQEVSIDYLGLGKIEDYRVPDATEFFGLLGIMLQEGLSKLSVQGGNIAVEMLDLTNSFAEEGFKNEWRIGPVQGASREDLSFLEFSQQMTFMRVDFVFHRKGMEKFRREIWCGTPDDTVYNDMFRALKFRQGCFTVEYGQNYFYGKYPKFSMSMAEIESNI